MREVGTVVVDKVFVRSAPSDLDDTIIGDLKRGDTFDVLGCEEHPRAIWLKFKHGDGSGGGKGGAQEGGGYGGGGRIAYVAERNRASGQRFVQVKILPPDVPDHPLKPSKPDYTGWGIGAVVLAGLAVLVYSCGGSMR